MHKTKILVPLGMSIVLFILMLTPLPIDNIVHAVPYGDKILHFILFCSLTVGLSTVLSIRKAVFLAIVLAVCSEYSQHFFTARYVSEKDLLANLIGIIFAWVSIGYIKQKRFIIPTKS